MSTNLADFIEGTPGRFVPEEMRGELVEAEHLARYLWAAHSVAGRRVLDAGCGMAYGSALMAEAGAKAVTGIDLADPVVDAARPSMPANVELMTGDVRDLAFPDASFDLVVCFEVIEHIAEQADALREFKRVLAPGGLLLISSPNRDVYVPGNPHHVHELTPSELVTALEGHFEDVRLVRQHDFVVSAVVGDATLRAADGGTLTGIEVHKVAGREPGEETYTLAIAGDNHTAADQAELMVVAAPVEVRHWLERFQEQQTVLERYASLLDDAERRSADRNELLARLSDVETQLAPLQRRLALGDAEHREEVTDLIRRLDTAEAARRRVEESRSWKLTQPLRRAGAFARAVRRGRR